MRSVVPRPARDVREARARFAATLAADPPGVATGSRAAIDAPAHRTELAVVLLHGFTNAPPQWAPFAAELRAAGIAVVRPRFPGHGYADHDTRVLAQVGADEYLSTTSDAVDVACGLGRSVVVAGLSIGGSIAAWIALQREDVSHAIALVPFFGVKRLGVFGNRILAAALAAGPSVFVPWDPSGRAGQVPPYGYPRFATRALAAHLNVGRDTVRRAHRGELPRGALSVVLNVREPACDNEIARGAVRAWNARRAGAVQLETLTDLPANHDIIDATNALERVDRVYPLLRRLIAR